MIKQVLYTCVGIMLLQATIFIGMGFGLDNAHLQQLKSTNKCEKCDLSNANLSNIDMYGVNLKGTNLSGSIINNADLTDAELQR